MATRTSTTTTSKITTAPMADALTTVEGKEAESNKIVELNVGGVRYSTSLTTLLKYSDSMLARMFSGEWELKVDKEGCYFIDADGDMFKYVLNFLRRSRLYLPRTFDEAQLDQLLGEAEYYQINPLIDAVKSLLPTMTTNQSTMVIFMRNRESLNPEVMMLVALKCGKSECHSSYTQSRNVRNVFEKLHSYSHCIADLKQLGYVSVGGLQKMRDKKVTVTHLSLEGLIRVQNLGDLIKALRNADMYEIWVK